MAIYMPKGAPKDMRFVWAKEGFDKAAFQASEAGRNAAEMEERYQYFQKDEMSPELLDYWAQRNVKKELFDQEDESKKYSVFTPVDMDKSKRYALVYDSHGGQQPINFCEHNGFPQLAGKEHFICVCPWNGGPSNDNVETEFPRILDTLLDKGYPIDEERVYAAGYSAGSDATGVLACAWPERIAAVSPDPGGNLFAKGRWFADPSYYEKNRNYRMPAVFVGGTMDGGDHYPFDEEQGFDNFHIWMEHIIKISGHKKLTLEESRRLVQSTQDRCIRAFGLDFQRTSISHMEGIDWLCGEYFDEKGVAAARFVAGDGLPHSQTKYHAPIVWDFLKHFRRDSATKESIYTPVVIDGIR